MMGLKRIVAVALSALWAAPTLAAPVTDCPMRDAPFSTASPVVDILLNPAAKKILETEVPGILTDVRPDFLATKAPTFAAILTVRELAGWKALTPDIARLNAALGQVPVTDADRVARCERYDNDIPRIDIPKGRHTLLLFEKINGFRDGPSVDAAHAAFVQMAERKGWAIVTTDRGGAITPAFLRRFDAVIWNNISGDVLTLSQRAALKSFVERGGGFVAVHGSDGDPATFWDWYVDHLIGARFAGHPGKPLQFQDAKVVIEGVDHPIAKGLPHDWVMNDEWYSFKNDPRAGGTKVIATLDESSYKPGEKLTMGDHPIAWTRCIGKGRMFYAAIGHRPETYSEDHYAKMLENAVDWAATKTPDSCRP